MASNNGLAPLTMEEFMEYARNSNAPDPSPRNPRVNKVSSVPDRVEAGYQADGHKTWGYVIYRTTYESDADWAEFMRRLRIRTTETMEHYNGLDVLARMSWTIFDDRELFDGADTATIRRHFRDWAETAIQTEQYDPAEPNKVIHTGPSDSVCFSPRYKYCVQVDAGSLKSAVHDAPLPLEHDNDRKAWVKLIEKDFIPESENPIFASDPDPNVYEPIDGVTGEDVGWVKCKFGDVMTEYYMLFRDPNTYSVCYRRPPAVVDDYLT